MLRINLEAPVELIDLATQPNLVSLRHHGSLHGEERVIHDRRTRERKRHLAELRCPLSFARKPLYACERPQRFPQARVFNQHLGGEPTSQLVVVDYERVDGRLQAILAGDEPETTLGAALVLALDLRT
jgi:hypothetical protein